MKLNITEENLKRPEDFASEFLSDMDADFSAGVNLEMEHLFIDPKRQNGKSHNLCIIYINISLRVSICGP
jgi:hypothetical protein